MATNTLLAAAVGLDLLAIVLAIAAGVYWGHPADEFHEDGAITLLSALQLLVLSGLGAAILSARLRSQEGASRRAVYALWGLMAVGFLFLAADELLEIHEGLDKQIHAFGLQQTGLTDRIDDLIIVLYGVAGAWLLWACRDEMQRFRSSFPFFIAGFALLLATSAIDVVTNRDDILSLFLAEEMVGRVLRYSAIPEESLKVLSEAAFLGGLYDVLRTARRAQPPAVAINAGVG